MSQELGAAMRMYANAQRQDAQLIKEDMDWLKKEGAALVKAGNAMIKAALHSLMKSIVRLYSSLHVTLPAGSHTTVTVSIGTTVPIQSSGGSNITLIGPGVVATGGQGAVGGATIGGSPTTT